MNAKQTAPLVTTLPAIAAAAPPLIIGGAIGLGIVLLLKWLLSDDDTEKKPETAPAKTETESRRKEAETTAFRPIPAEIPVKPAAVPVPAAPRALFHCLSFRLFRKFPRPPLCLPPLPSQKSWHKFRRRRRSKRNLLHGKTWQPSFNEAHAP